ncbi:MAG: hypothetical protein QOD56_527, partial [Gammaproteobacteria bacterium]|nr:hypothetical protein [Gammaproteobacteria bacterium]
MRLGQDRVEAGRAALTALREEERLLDRRAPAWWRMVFSVGAAREHRARVQANADAQIRTAHEIAEVKRNLSSELEPISERT